MHHMFFLLVAFGNFGFAIDFIGPFPMILLFTLFSESSMPSKNLALLFSLLGF